MYIVSFFLRVWTTFQHPMIKNRVYQWSIKMIRRWLSYSTFHVRRSTRSGHRVLIATPFLPCRCQYQTNKGPVNDDRFKGTQFRTNPSKRGCHDTQLAWINDLCLHDDVIPVTEKLCQTGPRISTNHFRWTEPEIVNSGKTADVTFSAFTTLSIGTPYVEMGKLQQRDRNEK